MIDLSALNSNQRKAVDWQDGPLLVLAGPGSGKTRVLTMRIARLIESSPTAHFKILGLTFTNKASAEMRDRILDVVTDARDRIVLTTFHSFAADLLRQHGHHIGLHPNFSILPRDEDRRALLDDAIIRSIGEQYSHSSERLLPVITRLTEQDVPPSDALAELRRDCYTDPDIVATVYREYRDLMIQRNTIDFAGLIAEALRLLRDWPAICNQIHRVYSFICVDEYQDTNLLQYNILCRIVNPKTRNVFVVGDEDQMIYQWNGASPERLTSLRKEFQMPVLWLPENYRCPKEIVDIANRLIANNSDRVKGSAISGAIKSASKDAALVVRRFSDFAEEVDWVAETISLKSLEFRQNCVILARTKRLLEDVISAMEDHQLIGFLWKRKSEFDTVGLQWMHSMLRLANSRNRLEHLSRVCHTFSMIEGVNVDVQGVTSHASIGSGDYLRSWGDAVLGRSSLSSDTRKFLEKALPRLTDRLDFWSFQDSAFKWLNGRFSGEDGARTSFGEYDIERDTWCELVHQISQSIGRERVTLHLLLQELDLRSKEQQMPRDAIRCLTIHSAKGMEFDHVFLVGMVEDQLPSWFAIQKGANSQGMQEERRNCFVAITRTRESLTITYSRRIHGFPKNPSRFLVEMGIIDAECSSVTRP